MKLSKNQLQKIGQSRGFLDRILGPLLKNELPFIKNVVKPLAISVLMQLGLTGAASATDAATHEKVFESGNTGINNFEWRYEWH